METRTIKIFLYIVALFLIPSFSHIYGATLSKPTNNLGLLGYWPFSEGTSTVVTDFSGRGNTGTMNTFSAPATASSGWGNGKVGKALNFDGSSDYIDMGNPANLKPTTNTLTLTAWVKPGNTGAGTSYIISKENASGDYFMRQSGVSGAVRCSFEGGSDAPTGLLVNGEWVFIACVWDGANAIVYKNGVSVFSPAATPTFSDNGDSVNIGRKGDGTSFFQGTIDEVRIYNRGLSASDILKLYNSGVAKINSSQNIISGSTLQNGLVGMWSFNGPDITDKVYDRSGNSNDGFFYGGATSTAKTIGKVGQGLRFDGVDDAVNIGDVNALDGISKMTVSAWVYQDSLVQSNSVVSKYSSSEEGWGILVSDQTAGGDDIMIRLSFSIVANIESIHSAGEWELWTFVFDGTQTGDANRLKFYKNGSQVEITTFGGTIPSTIPDTSSTLCISGVESNAGNGCTNNRFWNGKIDEVRVYNRTLTSAEVKQLYNLGSAKIR